MCVALLIASGCLFNERNAVVKAFVEFCGAVCKYLRRPKNFEDNSA